jgi:protein farnesyltransferase subunit beta
MPHLATTYAAVAALVTLGGADALSVVDTKALYAFFLRMCVPPERGGGMTMHEGGEVDVRGCYCALACCRMLCLDVHQLVAGCDLANFARRCQTGEGGLGGEPGNEAHGGYTFCGFAALSLAGLASKVDLERLIRWATRMQGWAEGGFMGRTCKLVDGCYSFWQGGLFPLLIDVLINIENQGDEIRDRNETADTSSDENLVKSADGDMLKIVEELISDASGVEQFVKGLHPKDPALAASARAAAAQLALDAAIDDSLAKEEEYMRAASVQQQSQKDLEQAKSQAIEALECAALIQTEFQSAQAHANVASCSATVVLGSLKQHGNVSDDANSDPMSAETEFLLYDARALQIWLLACCQARARGGLRDKPGKPADYYHTCYCLSGLSSAQHATRRKILGGTANKLAEADRLCNVRTDKLEAARRFLSMHEQL